MVVNCCVFGCNNRKTKESTLSFHTFPTKDPGRRQEWIKNISRVGSSGKPWQPTAYDRVCSAHFIPEDYKDGKIIKCLKDNAVPTVFPNYPRHKQIQDFRKRPPPKERPSVSDQSPSLPKYHCSNDHSYRHSSVEEHFLKTQKKLSETEEKLTIERGKNRVISQKAQRRGVRNSALLEQLKEQKLISHEGQNAIMENFGETLMPIIENELKSTSTSPKGMRYSDDVKSFATTLRFYSPKAYEYLRTVFTLPDESMIRRWATSLDCRPGFNRDMLSFMKEQLEKNSSMKDVTLMFDSMAIRSEYAYDAKNKCYSGSVDMGSAKFRISEDTLATEALVFMVVGLIGHWKQPIGYFLINKVSAEVQANIVQEAIVLMHDYRYCVRAVVCNGSHTNQATARKLGCSFGGDELIHSFPHPSNGEEVCFLLDACHLLKNVRNTLGDKEVIISYGKQVKWEFIQELHKLQLNDNLVLANKLRSSHIVFHKNKMKVKLAAQTISHSVATAIDFCRAHLHLPEFEGSEETTRFINVFNEAFDICNSSNPVANGFKSRIDRHNLQIKCNAIDNICAYIRQLQEPNGRLLINGPRKTAFIGFIVTLSSIKKLATNLLSNNETGFKSVLTYKLSQDHLETFFSMIRRRGGWNNNPNTMQFQYALRALLQKNGITPSKNANSVLLPSIDEPQNNIFPSIPVSSSSTLDPPFLKEFSEILLTPSEFHQSALDYVSGYVVRKILEKINCDECTQLLQTQSSEDIEERSVFTQLQDNGGLKYSTPEMFKLISTTDAEFRSHLLQHGIVTGLNQRTIPQVTLKVLEKMRPSLFINHDDHCRDVHFLHTQDDHTTQIVKETVKIFCNVMIHHHRKIINERYVHKQKPSIRHSLTKRILFEHQ